MGQALVQRGMNFHIVSLFPDFFDSPLKAGLMGRAQEKGLVTCTLHNPRDLTDGPHHTVDDRPYGGGPGMVMLLEPLVQTLRGIPQRGRTLVMSPAGRPFTQALARELAHEEHLTLVCGRYEGFDARLEQVLPVEYISMGDAVLNGGETPALAVMEAVGRLLPGFMGKEASGEEESFSAGLLEYPHYTRPERFEGHDVPEILRSGDHGRIAAWRRTQALGVTLRYRPDMLQNAPLTEADAAVLSDMHRLRVGRNLYILLVHYPVLLEEKKCGASSLTNLDIHDIARISCTYGLGGVYITTPLADQQRILHDVLRHWQEGAAVKHNPHRATALGNVRSAALVDEALAHIAGTTGQSPLLLGTSARWPHKKKGAPLMPFTAVRDVLHTRPVALLLGTGHGLAPQLLAQCDAVTPPVRAFDGYNHLSVRAAAAILTDRILGDMA